MKLIKFDQKGPTDDWEDVVQSDSTSFNCVDRWRNACPEQRKHMFSVFDESGIFIAACRHRFILLACDMVKSGELFVIFDFIVVAIADHFFFKFKIPTGHNRSSA